MKRNKEDEKLTSPIPEDEMADETTKEPTQQRHMKEEKVGILGPKSDGCIRWVWSVSDAGLGGVTSVLVSMSEASSRIEAVQCGDASTSTRGLAS
jgi:hypothetical protein